MGAPMSQAEKPIAVVQPVHGEQYAIYADPVFDSVCELNSTTDLRLVPPPQPLRNMSWVHFPKFVKKRMTTDQSRRNLHLSIFLLLGTRCRCGTSLTSVIYNYMCANTSVAPVFDSLEDPKAQNYFGRTCSYCFKPCLSSVNERGILRVFMSSVSAWPWPSHSTSLTFLSRSSSCKGFSTWAPHDGIVKQRAVSVANEKKNFTESALVVLSPSTSFLYPFCPCRLFPEKLCCEAVHCASLWYCQYPHVCDEIPD